MGRILSVEQQYNKSIIDRLILEGDGTGSNFSVTNSYGTFPSGLQSGAGISIGGMTVPHGKALYIDSIVVSSNKSAWFFCQTGGNYDGSYLPGGGTWTGNGNIFPITPVGGGTVVVPIKQIAHGFYKNATQGSVMSMYIKQVFDTDLTNCVFSVSVIGSLITDDFNVDSEKVVLWKGDSISAGIGVSSKLTMLPFLIRQRLFNKNSGGVRLICKAYGGTTSKWFDSMRKASFFDYEKVDYIFYQLGVNDTTQSTTNGEYLSNIQAEIAYNTIKYPTAKQIYLGSSPLNNNTNETTLSGFRTQMQNAVISAANPNVLYCSLASSFDRAVLSNYDASDGVHPNSASHISMYNTLDTFLNTNLL